MTDLSRIHRETSAYDMGGSSSTAMVALDTDICRSCQFTLHHPCEIFQMTDCPSCLDDVYDCENCEGTGKDLDRLEDGEFPTCATCDGYGKRRGCPECEGKGWVSVTGHQDRIQCEYCEGKGWRYCTKCKGSLRADKFLGFCRGDTFRGVTRIHRKIDVHPRKDEVAKEDWGEVVLPYKPIHPAT